MQIQLSLQEIRARHDEELGKLEEIRAKMLEQEKERESVEKQFADETAPELQKVLEEMLKTGKYFACICTNSYIL